MLELTSEHCRLVLDPARGGSIAAFEYSGAPIFRASRPGSILDTGYFPLVPFSNRIAKGQFASADKTYRLDPNFPEADPVNPLHGYGWLSEWSVIDADASRAVIEHVHKGDVWPWPYRARQYVSLADNRLFLQLEVTNLGEESMPAGLGFHPYFPRESDTLYRGLHTGEWRVDAHGLPDRLENAAGPTDWWAGQPVGARRVDTAYVGREGPLTITWPDRGVMARITPSENLDATIIYTPSGADFFCVEPVSHAVNAINRPDEGITLVSPQQTMQAWMHIEVEENQ